MATVEILFKAVDQASAVINKVTASVDKSVKTGFSKAADSLDRYGKSINSAVQSLTGMNLAQVGIAAVVGTTINQVRKSVDAWSTYVEQVDKGVQKTGMAAEEYSRLVQVADDFRVSMSEIESAMGMALKNGFNPTTENLAILADEINAITDPTERAAKLTGIFGRQWENVIPLLSRGGDAIREAAAGISDGLVVTDESIETNREYQAAVDDLGDAFSAMSNTMAREALPAITAVTEALANAATASANNQGTLAGVTGGYGRAAYAMQKAQRAMLYNADGARYTALAQAYLAENTDKLTGTIVNDNTELRYMKGHLDDAASRARNMAQASTDLATAIEGLQATQSEWKEGAGGDIASMLDENTIGSQRYEEALAAIDRVNGTNLLSAEKLNDAQAELVKQYQNGTMSIDEFEQGLTDINDAFMPLDESIKNSTELMQGLIEKMESFGGTVYTAVARVVIENALEGSTGGGNSNGVTPTNNLPTGLTDYTNYGNNSGGATPARNGLNDFVVPPGYSEPNKPYFIATSSNEHVTVTPAGQSSSSGNSNTVNIYPGAIIVNGASDPTETAQEVYRQFSKMIQDKSRSGAALAGRT